MNIYKWAGDKFWKQSIIVMYWKITLVKEWTSEGERPHFESQPSTLLSFCFGKLFPSCNLQCHQY